MINFVNLPDELKAGLKRASKTLCLDGVKEELSASVHRIDGISVKRCGSEITIGYKDKIHFFRALGLLRENLADGKDFEISERINFKTAGVMPDLSNYSPLTVAGLSSFMDYMAVMGLNMALLYIEDVYELPTRKYFGHQRGSYSAAELREIDDYAFDYGIEIIPCMQTLGHLEKYLSNPEAADVRETTRELNIDKEETYKFIEQMIIATTAPLRSKRIHVGMDEVWGLGRGNESLKKYGVRDQQELFLTHLERVVKITDRLGLRPMIWNDFVFCLNSERGIDKYDEKTEIPDDIIARFPKNLDLVYWHYGEEIRGCDDYMIKKNLKFGNNVIYAGGLIMWGTPMPDNKFSYLAAEEGLTAAKNNSLSEVFTALWCYGDKGSDLFTSLLHLQQFAEHTYHENPTEEHIKARFEACTGADFDAFMNTSYFHNKLDREYKNYNERYHGQKFLWHDSLLGKYEFMLADDPISPHYAKWADYYQALAQKSGKWADTYERFSVILSYLSRKTYLLENLAKGYQRGDRKFLENCAEKLIPDLISWQEKMHEEFRKMWFKTRKAFGWELLDESLGADRARIISAKRRIEAYLCGDTDEIEELASARLTTPESLWTY